LRKIVAFLALRLDGLFGPRRTVVQDDAVDAQRVAAPLQESRPPREGSPAQRLVSSTGAGSPGEACSALARTRAHSELGGPLVENMEVIVPTNVRIDDLATLGAHERARASAAAARARPGLVPGPDQGRGGAGP
jgi:hypothetical protein